jgi:uncharacterized membrane protein
MRSEVAFLFGVCMFIIGFVHGLGSNIALIVPATVILFFFVVLFLCCLRKNDETRTSEQSTGDHRKNDHLSDRFSLDGKENP